LAHEGSVIPKSLWPALVDSSFVLASFGLGLAPEAASAFCEKRGGIGAHIAKERARESGWNQEFIGYCTAILEKYPPRALSYLVEPGDSLGRIVRRRYSMSFDRLWPLIRVLNPSITDPNRIRAGRNLFLPVLGSVPK
jgi:hypothetical protein